MRTTYLSILFIGLHIISPGALASDVDFSGTWSIDFRSKSESNSDCGHAVFTLIQKGERICGDHVFSTVGCGRLNEGFPGSVRGIVIGSTAALTVTSGRNGAIVLGKATRKGDNLYWTSLEEIKAGEPEGDSPLILGNAKLRRMNANGSEQELNNVCQ